MLYLYGLKNCDSCRKAKKWLEAQEINYEFIDIHQTAPSLDVIQKAMIALGWELVLNRKSTTWRNLEDEDKIDINAQKAQELIIRHPNLIKRPLLTDKNNYFTVGFNEITKSQLLSL